MKMNVAFLMLCVLLGYLGQACGGRSNLRNQNQSVRGQAEQAADAATKEESELEALRRQLGELEAAQKTGGQSQAEIDRLQREIDKAKEELAKKDKENAETLKTVMGYSLQYKHSAKCLEIEGASALDGARVMQMPCVVGGIQNFRFIPRATGQWIQNVATGKCLASREGGQANGAQIVQSTCVDNGSMLFRNEADGDYVFIRNIGSNRCMDIEGIATSDRASAQLYDCVGGDAQRVKLIPVPNSYSP